MKKLNPMNKGQYLYYKITYFILQLSFDIIISPLNRVESFDYCHLSNPPLLSLDQIMGLTRRCLFLIKPQAYFTHTLVPPEQSLLRISITRKIIDNLCKSRPHNAVRTLRNRSVSPQTKVRKYLGQLAIREIERVLRSATMRPYIHNIFTTVFIPRPIRVFKSKQI